MTSQQLLTVVFIAIVANAVLIVLALLTMRNSRARRAESGAVDIVATHDRMVAMAGSQAGTPRMAGATPTASVMAETSSVQATGPAHATTGNGTDGPSRSTSGNGSDGPTERSSIDGTLAPINLETPISWRRMVDEEVVRSMRYHRPATVLIVELDGFERFTDRLGEAAGARLLVATARTLEAQARASDRCAQFGRGRFAVLLPETDDIKAINFAERVRSECDRWLDAGEISMRVAIGWALLDPAQGAGAAIEAAERRMDAERRHRAGSAA